MKAFIQSSKQNADKMVVQALVPFKELKDKAIFTQKELSLSNAGSGNRFDVRLNSDYYQRRLDPNKLKKIQKYIINSILDEHEGKSMATIFPSSMILATEWNGQRDNDTIDIQLEENVYVVDGQHRLMAMKQVYEDLSKPDLFHNDDINFVLQYIETYKFNCTILINYDLWEQGQVFANVNFTQKPVNRSLYYEIFGTEYTENPKDWSRNYIYLAHQLTKFMNDEQESPYFGKIKMLGTGEGYVSQAFFVEALTRHFKRGRIWCNIPENSDAAFSFLDNIKVEILSYFKAVSFSMSKYWGAVVDGKLNFICKTNGTGAFLRLLEDIHIAIYGDLKDIVTMGRKGFFCDEYYKKIIEMLKPIADIQDELFGPDSIYGGTGGKGLEVKLYNKMKRQLQLAKLISDNPIAKMTSSERLKALENIRHFKILGDLHFRNLTAIEEKLCKSLNKNIPSEIKALGKDCVIDKIGTIQYRDSKIIDENRISYSGECYSHVLTSSDDNNEDPLSMSFPTKINFDIILRRDIWLIDDKSIGVRINTNIYYM